MLEIHTKAIVKFMHKAKLHIQYPKVRLQCLDNLSMDMTIQLSVAGNKAKYPNSINITDDKPYGYSKFYGRILTDGQLKLRIESSIIEHELKLFAENPTGYAKLYSNATGNCMFCTRLLTDPQSVAVGYGPICAGHYDLPHGEIEQKVANDMAQIEMEIPELNSNGIKTKEYTDKIKNAYEFYIQSPDGQYDLFVADVLCMEYFTLTGENLEENKQCQI